MEKGEAMGVEVATDTTRKKVVNDDTFLTPTASYGLQPSQTTLNLS
jgi:hypothetical protein